MRYNIDMDKRKKVVLTYYWTGEHDVWHKGKGIYHADPREFDTLRESVDGRGYDFVTLANELKPDRENWIVEKPEQKPKDMTVYVHKFIACYEWLKKHPEYDEIWIVDSADTEMLTLPCPDEQHIYSGYDAYFALFKQFAPIKYLVGGFCEHVWYPGIFEMGHKYDLEAHRYLRDVCEDEIAWNCGIFGGKRKLVMEFLETLTDLLRKTESDTEMPLFNYVIFRDYWGRCIRCTTRMTMGEKDYNWWWRHK